MQLGRTAFPSAAVDSDVRPSRARGSPDIPPRFIQGSYQTAIVPFNERCALRDAAARTGFMADVPPLSRRVSGLGIARRCDRGALPRDTTGVSPTKWRRPRWLVGTSGRRHPHDFVGANLVFAQCCTNQRGGQVGAGSAASCMTGSTSTGKLTELAMKHLSCAVWWAWRAASRSDSGSRVTSGRNTTRVK